MWKTALVHTNNIKWAKLCFSLQVLMFPEFYMPSIQFYLLIIYEDTGFMPSIDCKPNTGYSSCSKYSSLDYIS